MDITFLGTGTSNGVPMIGCNCKICTSTNPKNHKDRCSIAITNKKGRVIIDTPPEFRLQCIRENISSLDAVLLTHNHADHIAGFDDLRGFSLITNRKIPVYGNEETISTIHQNYGYMFHKPINKSAIAKVDTRIIYKPTYIIGEKFTPLKIKHGKLDIYAYKFRNVVYCTDCSYIPEESWEHFYGLDVLIIDALRFAPHPTHYTFNKALRLIEEFKPKRAYLTHTTHIFDYDETQYILPKNIYLAYDGLKIHI